MAPIKTIVLCFHISQAEAVFNSKDNPFAFMLYYEIALPLY